MQINFGLNYLCTIVALLSTQKFALSTVVQEKQIGVLGQPTVPGQPQPQYYLVPASAIQGIQQNAQQNAMQQPTINSVAPSPGKSTTGGAHFLRDAGPGAYYASPPSGADASSGVISFAQGGRRWKGFADTQGKTYYQDTETGLVVWNPRNVFTIYKDSSGKAYFFNEANGQTTWNDPRLDDKDAVVVSPSQPS